MMPLVLSFQRCLYAHPTTYAMVNGVLTTFYVLPTKGCSGTSGSTSACSSSPSCLFLVALAIFGRLEGNFAEEL